MQEDRKTPEMRAQMTDIERLRHSAAHVLATAILKIWPEAQFAAGPPVENGFYYDVDLPHRISPDDFEKIEAEMKKEIKANHPFERMEVSRDEALDLGKKGRLAALNERNAPSKFKLDIIENIPPGETISLYRNGDFIDLCAGPHVMRTGNIGAFKLTSVASAYYKGDEKNPQLQRIYGTAFKTKKELDDYFRHARGSEEARPSQARQRTGDFRFRRRCRPRFADVVAARRGDHRRTREARARKPSSPPVINASALRTSRAKALYKKSGHLPYYAESMFPPMAIEPRRAKTLLRNGRPVLKRLNAILDARKELRRRLSRMSSKLQQARLFVDYRRSLLPQSDELSASSQVVCGGAAQLSRSAVALRGVRHLLSLRAERRVDSD